MHSVIREVLQGRKVSPEGISAYLAQHANVERYQSAFNKLWFQCTNMGLQPLTLSLEDIAGQLLLLHQTSSSQARNAYSALLLIPGFDQLRFSPMLAKCKRAWNQSSAKHATFWDASGVLNQLALESLDLSNVQEVRDRLIICWRLLGLHRSIDLARLKHTISMVGDTPFILL